MDNVGRIKPVYIGIAAFILIILGLMLLMGRKGGVISPIPEDGGVRIIFVTPHPSVAEPSASASASLKASSKPKPRTESPR